MLKVVPFICLTDNYCVLLHDETSGATAAIDAPDAGAIRERLDRLGWSLSLVLVTHHHHDHTGGVAELKRWSGCRVVGPAAEADRIPGIDQRVGEGDRIEIGAAAFTVIETPGHTAGHVAYWSKADELVFVGDTLFSLGCGRLFEGDAATMWQSLSKLATLPRETLIYCGHEYTEANGRFAATIEPANRDLRARIDEVALLRAGGEMTLPTTIARELATNPFLRAGLPEVQSALGMSDAAAEEAFAELRRRKDRFG
jgi:hydroxyacylglutathione hydrolase